MLHRRVTKPAPTPMVNLSFRASSPSCRERPISNLISSPLFRIEEFPDSRCIRLR